MRRAGKAEGQVLDRFTLAEGELQLPRLIPRQPEAAAERRTPHQAHDPDAEPQHERSVAPGPEGADRLRDAVRAGVVDALIPAARAFGEVGIIAHRVERGLHDAVFPWLGVLRHEENVAPAFVADLMHELTEGGCVGEVDVAIRLESVAVAAR